MSSNLRILISGAGVAGPTLAYFLARSGCARSIVVVERSPVLRTAGQTVDIRGAGLEVVRRMQVEDEIRAKTTQEKGIMFVDASNRARAKFPVDLSGKGMSFTAEIEILRGELAKVLYERANGEKGVEFRFGEYVKSLKGGETSVEVEFQQRKEAKEDAIHEESRRPQEFDLVVAADGMGSSTRALAFGQEQSKAAVKPLGQYVSYFTIPYHESDGTWSRWYNAPGGRCILLRPDNAGATRAFISIMSSADKLVRHSQLNVEEQKNMMRDLFNDAGWEAQRVLDGMDNSDDFYMQEIAQVKIDSWSLGRTALLGDAGYCPSPISGMGTSVAIVGAYVLAGEIAKHANDHKAAFAAYEEVMRPFVNRAQKLAPGAPAILNPQTALGISILHNLLGFVSWSGIGTLFGKFASSPADAIKLPDYGI